MPQKKHCPQIGKPCIEDRCIAWDYHQVEETTEEGKQVRMKGACTVYFWVPLFLRDIVRRTDGTQQSIDFLRRESGDGSRALVDVFGLAANRALQLRHEKD